MTPQTPPPAAQEPKNYVLAWIGALLLILVYVFGLLMFPPNAEVAEPTKMSLFIGRFHPILVHLPIGALTVLVLVELLCLRRKVEEQLGSAALLMLFVGAAGAVVAVLAGIMLSREGGYEGGNFTLHMWMGIAGTGAVLLALVMRVMGMSGVNRGLLDGARAMFLAGFAVMGLGAHFGGNMVHGNKYLTEYAPDGIKEKMIAGEKWMLSFAETKEEPAKAAIETTPKAPAPPAPTPAPDKPAVAAVPTPTQPAPPPAPAPAITSSTTPAGGGDGVAIPAAAGKVVFKDIILPVLEQKCNKCHNEQKSKGDLRMDTHEMLLKGGGDDVKTVIAGKPEDSLFVLRVKLPIDDDEHMPPEGRDQMTPEELSLVSWWIQSGASETQTADESKFPAETQALVEGLVK
ncbi:MAG: hypothetical protein KDK97_18245 [Verrucomicrobiales bacterium]|nr:hypothetical protein [Verrucomicrobiales bacterium]